MITFEIFTAYNMNTATSRPERTAAGSLAGSCTVSPITTRTVNDPKITVGTAGLKLPGILVCTVRWQAAIGITRYLQIKWPWLSPKLG